MRSSSRFVLATLVAITLLGSGACSSDGNSTTAANSGSQTAGNSDSEGEAAQEAIAESLTDDGDRAFGLERDVIGEALVTAIRGAERYEVDGDTMKLFFEEGSYEDPLVQSNCRIAAALIGEEDGLVLVYPDGDLDCRAAEGN